MGEAMKKYHQFEMLCENIEDGKKKIFSIFAESPKEARKKIVKIKPKFNPICIYPAKD